MEFLDSQIRHMANLLNTNSFIIYGTIAIVLVSLICGAVGSLVVGNRMAFFSDALAHSAFAGISLGIVSFYLLGGRREDEVLFSWYIPLVTTLFGAAVGIGIAFVREKTGLANDTVIGVFFAGALAIGALVFANMKLFTMRNVEVILFGSTNFVQAPHLVMLAVLGIVTAIVLTIRYNHLVFASFNPSLARSRRIPVRIHNYMFIVLLALIVNICLQIVGVILINAMLLVPAASASLVCRNMRQMFWWTMSISLTAGLLGQWVSLNIARTIRAGQLQFPASGCVVVLNVLVFGAAMAAGRYFRGRQVKMA